jgi:hypothetical protein
MRLIPILFAACLSLQACAQLPFKTVGVPEPPERSALLLDAMGYIGTPYVRGGNTGASGLDCSGFVKAVFEQAEGITLPRSAYEQAHATVEIDRADLQPGDFQHLTPGLQPRGDLLGRRPLHPLATTGRASAHREHERLVLANPLQWGSARLARPATDKQRQFKALTSR